jgi:predicted house-cleaning noncanonical NTP pyrophosphatase (MazG superfamily)
MMTPKYLFESSESNDSKIVGLKASNLYQFKNVSPEFIVLSSDFYNDLKNSEFIFSENYNKVISEISKLLQKKQFDKVILRSSCTSEELKDRGKFLTEISSSSVSSIKSTLLTIYNDFNKSNKDENRSLAIIIQEYKIPKVQGHLSNERRVDKSEKVWIIEREFASPLNTEAEKITVNTEVLNIFDDSIKRCFNINTLNKNLNTVAAWFSSKARRVHIEWLWDGVNFWIVQVDYEEPIEKGVKPANDWYSVQNKRQKFICDFEVFESVESSKLDWFKIKCVKKFVECKLPYWGIHVLENPKILSELSLGEINSSLERDLKKLLITPIIVRSDVKKNNGASENLTVLLPRTETLYDFQSVVKFLIEKSRYFIGNGLASDKFSFLIHQFVPSNAGAFSYATPGIDRVRIDSTWGIVEGLYFHPHDSFEVKLSEKKINRKIRCKNQYIDFDKNGNWYSKNAGTSFDWKPSLNDSQLRTIAKYSQDLANSVGNSITVMFFVNNKKFYPEILPWIFQENQIPTTETNYTNVFFSDKKITITSIEDFENFKNNETSISSKVKLLIKLKPELYRDKNFIEEIATFSKKKNFVIDIEGSILSHPYYVFQSMGVNVRCVDPFKVSYDSQEFHKLVRDKIPVLIENHQESALVTKVNSNELLQLLKEKAIEEALELYWSKNNDEVVEEMADLLEVIVGACKAYGIDFEEIKNIAKRKREKRGGFENGVLLVATKENSLFQLIDKKSMLFKDKNAIDDVKLRPILKYFQKGEVKNFKSLTEIEEIRLNYINNYASKGNKFRYLLKKGDFNAISIEYREKDIILKFENLDLDINPLQLKLL